METGPNPTAVPAAPHVLPRLDTALNRVGARGPVARDAVLAGCVALGSIAVLVPLLGPFAGQFGLVFRPAEQVAVLVLVAVQALLLVLRRVRPVTCLLAVVVLQAGLAAVLPVDVAVRMLAPIIAAYSVGAYRSAPRALRALAAAILVEVLVRVVVVLLVRPGARGLLIGADAARAESPWSIGTSGWLLTEVSVVLLCAGAGLAGMVVASRRRYDVLVREQVAAAAAQEQARVQAAVVGERSRMARELHDIAAHHLSGLVVQAAAAERLVDREPEAAKRATRAIRLQGKETLANLRAVVGVLRETDPGVVDAVLDAETGAPVPGSAALDRLLEAARESGDYLEVTVHGEPYGLPPLADVTVYRVVQEALANARQHAPGGTVEIVLAWNPAEVRLEVVNVLSEAVVPAGKRVGYGLVGMRERAELSGATLDAGPAGRTWRVRLIIPRLDRSAGQPEEVAS